MLWSEVPKGGSVKTLKILLGKFDKTRSKIFCFLVGHKTPVYIKLLFFQTRRAQENIFLLTKKTIFKLKIVVLTKKGSRRTNLKSFFENFEYANF